jgi:hypothetical protein
LSIIKLARYNACGRAYSFATARAAFEVVWREYLSRRTPSDFQSWRDQQAWTTENIGASIAASGCHTIGDPVSDRGWKRAFALPSGRELVTLEDAGTYITKLFKAEHEAPEWQAAVEALIA